MRRRDLLIAGSASLFAQNMIAHAADDYPSRPVTLVVPLAPGGAADIVGRMLAQHLSRQFGQPFVVENRPGAGTLIGAAAVAKAMPDGYTLMVAGSGTLTTNTALYRSLPYDPVRDFVLVAHVTKVPLVLVVNTALPVKSLADLIRLARESTKPLTYASSGPGTSNHLAAELFRSMTGTALTQVAYRNSPAALTDIVAGHIPMMFADVGSGLPMVQDGKVRALGVSSSERLASAPEIPTIAEAGIAGFEAVSWHMIVAPAGTPPEIVGKLRGEMRAVMALPETQQKVAALGITPVATPGEDELKKFVAAETALWTKIVQQAGLAGTQ